MVVDLSVLLSGYCGAAAAVRRAALRYVKQQADTMLRPVVLQRIVRRVPFFSGLMQAGVSLGRK